MGATLRVKWELLMNWNLCNDHRSVFDDTKKIFSDSVNHPGVNKEVNVHSPFIA